MVRAFKIAAIFCMFLVSASGSEVSEIVSKTVDLRADLSGEKIKAKAENDKISERISALKAANEDISRRSLKLEEENDRLRKSSEEVLRKIEREKAALKKFSEELNHRIKKIEGDEKIRGEILKSDPEFFSKIYGMPPGKRYLAFLRKLESLYEADSKGLGVFVGSEKLDGGTARVK